MSEVKLNGVQVTYDSDSVIMRCECGWEFRGHRDEAGIVQKAAAEHTPCSRPIRSTPSAETPVVSVDAKQQVLDRYPKAIARQCVSWDLWHIYADDNDHDGLSISACQQYAIDTEEKAWKDAASRLPQPVEAEAPVASVEERKSVYVVLISGEYTSSINGVEETARRAAVAGVFDAREAADSAMNQKHVYGKGWGLCAMWVDEAEVGQPLFLE